MILINEIELPLETQAIRLEPSEDLDKAVYSYSEEDDILTYHIPTLLDCFIAQGMTWEEAWDWFNYNTLGTYAPNYPNFLDEDGDIWEAAGRG